MKAKIRIPTTAKAAKGKPAAKPPPPTQPRHVDQPIIVVTLGRKINVLTYDIN